MKYIFNGITIEYNVSNNNCCIKDSFRIKDIQYMKAFITYIKKVYPEFCKRSDSSYINEWKAHNILYRFGLFKAHTKDVDLNINESKFRRFIYTLLALFVK